MSTLNTPKSSFISLTTCQEACLTCTSFTDSLGSILYTCATTNNDNKTIIIICVVISVLIILVLAIIILMKFKSRKTKLISTLTRTAKIQALDNIIKISEENVILENNNATFKHAHTNKSNNNLMSGNNTIKHMPRTANGRPNIQPQQILNKLMRENVLYNNLDLRSKPVSEDMLKDDKLLLNTFSNDGCIETDKEPSSPSHSNPIASPVNLRKRSYLKFNYKQLKMKELGFTG
jgi:hypothetical protein